MLAATAIDFDDKFRYPIGFPEPNCCKSLMEQNTLRNVNNYLNTNIYSYLETSGGQSSNLYLKLAHFSTPVLIRHLWQTKTIVFLHWCLRGAVLLPGNLIKA